MRRLLGAVVASVLAFACGCRALPNARPSVAAPSLERIFAGAELLDQRPALLALAPDGTSVVVRWSPGIALWSHDQGALRVIATASTRADEPCGVKLADLLPPPPAPAATPPPAAEPASSFAPDSTAEFEANTRAEDREPSAWTYADNGGDLYVARGTGLWRVDPVARTSFELLPERAEKAVEAASQPAGSLGAIEQLAWNVARDRQAEFWSGEREVTTHLLVYDTEDLYVVGSAVVRGARALERSDLGWWSEPLAPKASTVHWSNDLSVAFCEDAGIVRAAQTPESTAAQDTVDAETQPAAEFRPQVWRHDEQRAVELDGFADLQYREDERLSPDGRWVFALVRDKSRAKSPIPVPNYLTERVSTTDGRRETAGDGPWPVRLLCWDATTGERFETHLIEPFDIGWIHVVGSSATTLYVRWTAPDWSCQQYFEIEPRSWNELQRPRECSEGWVGGPANTLVLDEENRVWGASRLWYAGVERDGRSQLESNADAPLPDWDGEVDEFRAVESGGLLVESSTRDPGVRELLRIAPNAEAGWIVEPLQQPRGFNRAARASSDAGTVAFVHEASGSPAEIWVSDGSGARALTATTPASFHATGWIAPQRRAFESADGTRVWANVWTPQRRDAPCVVFVHGAGYLQNVTDSLTEYPLNWMFHSRLAQLGYAVVDVDYRGSKGYGRKFRTDVQYRLGVKELEDMHAVLDALAAERVLDPERVGLYGGSYGGFLTLMALFREPGRWRCGAALRSVTDWRSYHPTYTQPRLGKPSTHPEAYAASSPIDHAEGLADPLLLLHGLRDDNVFAQDSLRLADKLVLLGKKFELMVYPSQSHAYDSGPHWLDQYERIENFLRRHLGEP
jgi:acetyl esterase/lipase